MVLGDENPVSTTSEPVRRPRLIGDKVSKKLISRIWGTRLGRNTVWSGVGYGSRFFIQAVYFVIIARKLGAQNYGAFAGMASLASFLAPFSSWGSTHIMVKNVARSKSSFSKYWGGGLATCVVSSLGFFVFALALTFVFFGNIPVSIVVLVCLSDLIFLRFVDLSTYAFQAHERLAEAASVQTMIAVVRLLAALVLLIFFRTPATAVTWGVLYVSSTTVGAVAALLFVRHRLGWGPFSLRPMSGSVREGFHFAVTDSSLNASNDIDKLLVGRLDSLDAAGFYAAAYRIEATVLSPVYAMVQASYARFFREGATGVRGSALLAKRLMPWALAYAVAAVIFLFLISPLLPRLFGPGYQETAVALRWIALLPLFRTVHYLGAVTLAGGDKQKWRSVVQLSIAGMNLALNLVLIPRFGWVAAAWTSLASDGGLAIGFWALVLWFRSREVQPATETSAG